MSAARHRYLRALGIPVWGLRSRAAAGDVAEELARPEARPGAAAAPSAGPEREVGSEWARLAAEVAACTRCALHRTRTQTVFGVGRQDADLVIVGEAPGAEEDRQGEPFVGPAGQLLNAMLGAIGLSRGEVYIANILKCRPPGNRDPKPEEQATCTPYLDRQIELIEPRAILALGRIAAQWLLQSELPIGRLRGQQLHYGKSGIPLIVTYHPAYLLRSPAAKAKSWQDLCMIRDLISMKP